MRIPNITTLRRWQQSRCPHPVRPLIAALPVPARRDHLLASYAASVARELSADAGKLHLHSPDDNLEAAALQQNVSMLQRMKSVLKSRS